MGVARCPRIHVGVSAYVHGSGRETVSIELSSYSVGTRYTQKRVYRAHKHRNRAENSSGLVIISQAVLNKTLLAGQMFRCWISLQESKWSILYQSPKTPNQSQPIVVFYRLPPSLLQSSLSH
jgi:hypothetical protein